MLATTPIPTAVPKLGPGVAGAAAAPTAAPGAAPKVDDAPIAPASQAADGAKAQVPAPAGDAAPVDAAAAAAAAKQSVIEKLQSTTAAAAIAQVDEHLGKLATMSVGGGTPEGAESAKVASALLTDSSLLLQHANVKALETLRDLATELQMRVMNSVSGLAYIGGQVAIAGQSKTPVNLADITAGPISETKAAMADVVEAITPKDAPAADTPPPAGDTPPPAGDTPPPAGDKVVTPEASRIGTPTGAEKSDTAIIPVPDAPNGNTGVAGGVAAPGSLQHVTPGPGVGPGPHPA